MVSVAGRHRCCVWQILDETRLSTACVPGQFVVWDFNSKAVKGAAAPPSAESEQLLVPLSFQRADSICLLVCTASLRAALSAAKKVASSASAPLSESTSRSVAGATAAASLSAIGASVEAVHTRRNSGSSLKAAGAHNPELRPARSRAHQLVFISVSA